MDDAFHHKPTVLRWKDPTALLWKSDRLTVEKPSTIRVGRTNRLAVERPTVLRWKTHPSCGGGCLRWRANRLVVEGPALRWKKVPTVLRWRGPSCCGRGLGPGGRCRRAGAEEFPVSVFFFFVVVADADLSFSPRFCRFVSRSDEKFRCFAALTYRAQRKIPF